MKIFAIGMNYAAHNQELHGTLKRPDEPVIFTKADSAILNQGKPFFVPDHLGRIDYETEVVVRICRLGKSIPQRIGEWVPKEKLLTDPESPCEQSGLQRLHFHLDIQTEEDRRQGREGKTVQEGCTSDMLYTVDEIIAYISQFFTLKTGDLLYTGTPAGVGPVHIGDRLEGWLENRQVLAFNCK